MKKTILFALVLVLGLTTMSLAAEYNWAQKADMPTARFVHSASVVDGKIYVIGGMTSEPDSVGVWPMEVYDPIADSWVQGEHIPTGGIAMATAVVNGKIYVTGGYAGSGVLISAVQEYNPATDTWTRKADLPTPRFQHAASVVDGKMYAIGGVLTPTNPVGLSTVEVYDPVTDTWTPKANMPFGVWGLCTTVVDGKIYALGGRPGWEARPYVQEYDPATDTWTRKSDMPFSTSGMGSVVLGDKIIVIGGWLRSGNYPYTAVQMYDLETDTWTIESDAPFLRAAFSASVVNNRIYAIGGTDRPHPCPATSTVYELTVGPPPDFNGDGIVDAVDVCIMVDYWGEDDSLCDIGPMPWGDGVVDVEDLKVLAEHLFEEVDDPTLIAHWALDETDGMVVADGAGDNNGYALGDPIWQPDAGLVDGALQLDGVDDYVITGAALNPTEGPFSILAWVNGGSPGQVIVSQQGAANWLMSDTEGNLMTELKNPVLNATELQSQAIITDGDWHRVGLVWDGANRKLYVDGVAVAEDTQDNLEGSENGLHIGCGKAMEAGSFFSGLIDDVRIYTRAVHP
ncbi:MAG: Kelch repeat-containing protein [Planctomycetota bacterium]